MVRSFPGEQWSQFRFWRFSAVRPENAAQTPFDPDRFPPGLTVRVPDPRLGHAAEVVELVPVRVLVLGAGVCALLPV